MSKQHFVKIAATLKARLEAANTPEAREAVMQTIHDLAQDFGDFNPRFDAFRFKGACGALSSAGM